MIKTSAASAVLLSLLLATGAGAGAQVHRCGDGKTYTDKPCAGATEVDVRSNLLQAGPRFFPKYEAAPALVVPDTSRMAPTPGSGSIWQRRDNRQAGQSGRVGYSR
ncbi:MAG: hypothetical protein JWP65_3336 [Ramlibacter sp.]|uniref:hypothetical protein n=1 Tax=Ramlibacter sp. TaxID=1917967 RepID=UPI002601A542|nr:hypothetical protein [Ramlibacter sp.]MDB5752915.1 hypothetical protein [Ramlibacter sp.]